MDENERKDDINYGIAWRGWGWGNTMYFSMRRSLFHPKYLSTNAASLLAMPMIPATCSISRIWRWVSSDSWRTLYSTWYRGLVGWVAMGTMLKLDPSPSSEDGSFESRSMAGQVRWVSRYGRVDHQLNESSGREHNGEGRLPSSSSSYPSVLSYSNSMSLVSEDMLVRGQVKGVSWLGWFLLFELTEDEKLEVRK